MIAEAEADVGFPLVSILVSTRNQGKYIERTLNSILNQDYAKIEVLVHDGLSIDNTVQVLKEYSTKIYWESTCDEGEYDGYNKLLPKTKGDFIKIVPSDDLLLPNAISRCVDFLLENPDVDIVFGFSYVIDDDGRILGLQGPQYKNRPFTLNNYLVGKVNHSFHTALFRRKIFEKVGYFNALQFKHSDDFEFFARSLYCGSKVAYISDYLGGWRQTNQNQSVRLRKAVRKQILGAVKLYGGRGALCRRILYDFMKHKLVGIPRICLGKIKWSILGLFGIDRSQKFEQNPLFS